jgi:hypothetical protein
MKPDMIVSWDQHLKRGNVWRAQVEMGMQDTPGEEPYVYTVEVYVVAPTQALAQYIVATMYPDHESLCIDDEPVGASK